MSLINIPVLSPINPPEYAVYDEVDAAVDGDEEVVSLGEGREFRLAEMLKYFQIFTFQKVNYRSLMLGRECFPFHLKGLDCCYLTGNSVRERS